MPHRDKHIYPCTETSHFISYCICIHYIYNSSEETSAKNVCVCICWRMTRGLKIGITKEMNEESYCSYTINKELWMHHLSKCIWVSDLRHHIHAACSMNILQKVTFEIHLHFFSFVITSINLISLSQYIVYLLPNIGKWIWICMCETMKIASEKIQFSNWATRQKSIKLSLAERLTLTLSKYM